MGRKKVYTEDRVQRSVYMSRKELDKMHDNGISVTKFFTQAWIAYKDGKFKYKYRG